MKNIHMEKQKQWRTSLLKNIQLQLFISFVSLPFLIGWGLPISLLTPVSTLIFGPFLTCFLLVSSLIFFLELFYLPNGFLVWCLEQITTIWLACLNLEQRAWLIGFQKPPLLVLACIPLIALAIVHSKKIITLTTRTGLLALLLVTTCAVLKLFPYTDHSSITTIACNKGAITVINHNPTPLKSAQSYSAEATKDKPYSVETSYFAKATKDKSKGKQIIMIDPAYIASRPNYESFISYTLVPEIIKTTGSMHINHLIMCKLNKRILDAIQFLATKIEIKNLYIPAWKGKIPPFAWRSYISLKKTILANNGTITSISYKKKLALTEPSSILFIEPSDTKNICYYDAIYKPLSVHGIINNKALSL